VHHGAHIGAPTSSRWTFMKNRLTKGFVLCTSLLLMACNFAEYDWYKARSANTLAAYQAFVREHPGDKHADDARGRILALQDDADWNTAQNLNTIAAFQDYLQKESGGVHVLEARQKLDDMAYRVQLADTHSKAADEHKRAER